MRLGYNGVDRVRLLRKIPPRLHGTNIFTTSAHFEPSFLRFPNGTKCTQIVWNAPKHKFRSQQGQSGVFVAKNYDATLWHKLLHQFGPFCTEFWKATKRSKMHPNCTKLIQNMSLESNGVDRVHSLRKIPIRLCGTNFCTTSARFALCFVRQPNGPKCSQIV